MWQVKPEDCSLFDWAAKTRGKTRTDFILDGARRAAEDTMLNRVLVHLSAEAYDAFLARLDAPPKPDAALKKDNADQSAVEMTFSAPTLLSAQHDVATFSCGHISLGRLAIGEAFKGQGLGRALFRDAALRVLAAAETIGIRGMLVHAISDEAAAFYRALGLEAMPDAPRTLMVSSAALQASLSSNRCTIINVGFWSLQICQRVTETGGRSASRYAGGNIQIR